jgi:hypothetical protein
VTRDDYHLAADVIEALEAVDDLPQRLARAYAPPDVLAGLEEHGLYPEVVAYAIVGLLQREREPGEPHPLSAWGAACAEWDL